MSYSDKEVRGLIRNWHELNESKEVSGHGLHILCVLADLQRALEALRFEDMVNYSILNMVSRGETSRDIGYVLAYSHVTIQNRIESSVSWIVRYLNEGV